MDKCVEKILLTVTGKMGFKVRRKIYWKSGV